MVVAAYIEVVGHRAVGDHHVEAVHRQVGQQGRQPSFATDQADRLGEAEGWLDQPVGHHLRHRVGDADAKRHALRCCIVTNGVEQFVAQRENLFGVAEQALAGFRELQPAPDAAEQFDAEHRLEFAQLAADRLRRQVQLLAGAGDAAGLGDHPEVAQVFVVEIGHG